MAEESEIRGNQEMAWSKDGPSPHTMLMQGIVEKLSRIPFLAMVHSSRLDKLAKASFLRNYQDGQQIVCEGEHGHTVFLVLNGQVAVEALNASGKSERVTLLSAGEWFGEGALLGRTRRTATIVSHGPSLLLEVEKIRIEKINKIHTDVIPTIQKHADRRAIETFLRQHRAFSKLNPPERQALVAVARLKNAPRGDTLFEAGAVAESVMIMKTGVSKLFRVRDGGTHVLAYFNAGDVIGLHDDGIRPGSLVTMGWAEVIEVPKKTFQRIMEGVQRREPDWGEQFHKAEIAPARNLAIENSESTVFGFVDALMADGAQQAQSLLTIDLDLCVRCGNCVQSCEARHGHAKLTRRGKKLTRRRNIEQKGDHKAILFPSSCRHCDSPECMIGCPTGAIHRKPSGEVAIHDFCIGCSNCALRCPWDNITMVETPGRTVNELATPKVASKCDLCAGYDEPNCVHNCPTKAILRVEPTSYFEEVRGLLRTTDDHAVGGARTETQEKRDLSRPVLWTLALLLAGLLIAVYVTAEPYHVMSRRGIALGVAALALFLGAGSLAARRRFNRFPRRRPKKPSINRIFKTGALQFGRFFWWVRGHVLLGGLALLAVLLHSGFRSGALLTSLLIILLGLEVVTGLAGVLFYRWFPAIISRLERDSLLEEDVAEELRGLLTRREQLLEEEPKNIRNAVRRIESRVDSMWGRMSATYNPKAADARALEQVGPLISPFELTSQKLLEKMTLDAVRVSEIRAILGLYFVRRSWLVIHIGISAMLLSLTILHVWSVSGFVRSFFG